MTLGVHRIELPDPPLAELLDDDDPDVQLALLQFLGQYIRYSWDAEELLPGVDLPDKLNPLLRSRDERVRRAAIHYAHDVGGSANREALIDVLQDPDEQLRDVAFQALYLRLPEHEVRDLPLGHEATPAQRAIVLEYETRWREREPGFSRVADPAALRTMLASGDPRQRRDALRLAGFTGDPALVADIESSRRTPIPPCAHRQSSCFDRSAVTRRPADP